MWVVFPENYGYNENKVQILYPQDFNNYKEALKYAIALPCKYSIEKIFIENNCLI